MESNLFTHLKNKSFEFTLALCIFSMPFHASLLLYEKLWGRGFSNPYTSIHLTSFDLLLLATTLFYFFFTKKSERTILQKTKVKPFYVVLIFASFSIVSLLQTDPNVQIDLNFALLSSVKLLELPLFFLLIQEAKHVQPLIKVFFLSMAAQSLWGVLQVLLHSDLGFQILGEPHLSLETAQIARLSILNWPIVRAYGSFPHPNILAAFLVTSLLCTIFAWKGNKKIKAGLLTLQGLGLLATFSRSAYLALLLGLSIGLGKTWLKKHKRALFKSIPLALSLLLLLVLTRGPLLLQDPALIERYKGWLLAWEMLKAHPLGVGFHNYTHFLDQVSTIPLMPWEYQPVHNIFFLITVEWGLPLSFLALYLFFKTSRSLASSVLLYLLPLGLLDHYLFSLETGNLLWVFALALFAKGAFTKAEFPSKTQADPKETPPHEEPSSPQVAQA